MKHGRRAASALLLCLTLFEARADLDVTVPPGLPPEWIRFLPTPTLTDLGRVPRAAGKRAGRGSVESVPVARGPRFEGGVDTAFGFSGITTIDLPQHFTWSVPRPPKGQPDPRELTGPGAVGLPPDWRYPPALPVHLYWLALATMLRESIHPALTSRTATVEYLVLLGEPAYLAALGADREPGLSGIAEQIKRHVGPLPADRPRPGGGKDAYQRMLHRLALVELASGFPYGPDRRFARRLMSLAGEGLGPVLHYTRHTHPLVRRNATALLGKYSSGLATVRLRVLLGHPDRVVRNRALQALADRRDTFSVPALIAALKSPDAGLRVLAAAALGQIGDRRALKDLVDFAAANTNDADQLWAAVPAIGRLARRGDKQVLAQLARLEARLRANKKLFGNEIPIHPPPVPDRTTTALVLAEMCRLARAGMGDPAAGAALLQQIQQGGAPKKTPRRVQQLGNTLARRGAVLRGLAPANLFLACEMLARMGQPGNELLWRVVEDVTEEAPVRAHALDALDGSLLFSFVELPGKLAELAEGGDSALVRARALALLEPLDEALALRTAKKIVEEYAGTPADFDRSARDWVVIPAMRLLGRKGAAELPLLLRVIVRAEQEQEEGEARRKKIGAGAAAANPALIKVVSVPPILQAALIELGRTGKPQAATALLPRLADPTALARGETALALAAIGGRTVQARLIGALADGDPWVRFCAYRGLRRLCRADFFCDWLFAPRGKIAATVKQWQEWWRGQKK